MPPVGDYETLQAAERVNAIRRPGAFAFCRWGEEEGLIGKFLSIRVEKLDKSDQVPLVWGPSEEQGLLDPAHDAEVLSSLGIRD